ncbi:MAG: plasmid recombination protein, partial [Dehalococcoidia bacterium]|nr:plasmid recombination protein [Dehalococcoidia bacterium]
NFHIVQAQQSYLRETNHRIAEAGCKVRKDSIRFVDTLITASPEFFKGKNTSEVKAFFQEATDFLSKKIGSNNIFAAVVHMDEKTPHMHLCFTPITSDGRLCAKEIIGNRTHLTKWQDNFHEHMVKQYPDLERGESASKTHRKHIPPRVFKQAVHLTRQAEKIKDTLDSINPFNAGKKRDEVISLLKTFFPNMEKLETQVKKYQKTINYLEAQNKSLTKRAEAGGKLSLERQLDHAELQASYHNLKQFVDKLSPEIKNQVKSRNIEHER